MNPENELETLRWLRDKLVDAAEAGPVTVLPQVSSQLASVLKRIAELAPVEEVTLEDELKRRRDERNAG